MGIAIATHILYILRFGDSQVGTFNNNEYIQYMIFKVIEDYQQSSLTLKIEKPSTSDQQMTQN